MYKITSRWSHQNSIKIEWNLGKRCNYDCSYCPAEIHDNSSSHTDIEILKSTVDKLLNIGKPIRLSFTGGEPTVHPKFNELIRYCRHTGVNWISVTTNGTRHLDYYQNLEVDQYIFSLHFEYDLKRTLDTIIKLKERSNKHIVGQIMAHHDHMINVRTVRSLFNNLSISNTVRRIRWTDGDRDLFDDLRYHPDDLAWVKEQESTVSANCVIDGGSNSERMMHSNDIIKLHLNKFKDWSCAAGIESLMINWSGDVYRATCRVGGNLGNIYTGTFDIPTSSIICDRNYCTCSSDIPLTKIDLR